MKKVSKILIVILLSYFLSINVVFASTSARTLAELKSELATLKSKKANNENSKAQTKKQIETSKNNIYNARNEIQVNQGKVDQAKNDIVTLNGQIEETKESIKTTMQTYQMSSNDNAYLEYVFDAKTYEELVYRYAVVEQIIEYNKENVDKYNDLIEKNKQLQVDLANREVSLNNQISSLSTKIDDLGAQLTDLDDLTMDIQDEINSTADLIKYYEQIGCSLNQNLNECVSVAGDTSFRRPVGRGQITSYFGYRSDPVTGKGTSYHSGVDIGGPSPYEGTNVYSIANGMVGKIIERSSSGGNQVYIYHTINGVKYTSAYLHLLRINVSLGQVVTSNTVIGAVGGYSTSILHGGYDTRTTGAHLHLGLAKGWYGSTYTSNSSWKANLLNPKTTMNLPNSWTSR